MRNPLVLCLAAGALITGLTVLGAAQAAEKITVPVTKVSAASSSTVVTKTAAVITKTAASVTKTAAATSTAAAVGGTDGASKAIYPKPEEMDALAQKDPLEFLKAALKWSEENVAGYTCQFTKQEKIGDELGDVETMQMKFRESAFSVYLKWIGDTSKGQEVIYSEGLFDNKAVVHPSGFLGILFRRVPIDPESKLAMKHSRRPITSAGMTNMLRLIVPQCEESLANGDLTLTYEGLRDQGGRPTHVIKRVLPNQNNNPCAVLTIYIDREYMICVRTDAFNWDGSLLSQYIYSDFVINPAFTDLDFDPDNKDYSYRLF
jgi:hypothetical protein